MELALFKVTTSQRRFLAALTSAQLQRLHAGCKRDLQSVLQRYGYLAVWECRTRQTGAGTDIELVQPVPLFAHSVISIEKTDARVAFA